MQYATTQPTGIFITFNNQSYLILDKQNIQQTKASDQFPIRNSEMCPTDRYNMAMTRLIT